MKKEINVFLNYKLLKQVNKIKYLGIIMDNKFKFTKLITYAAEKCTKLICNLSKSAKITWELRHEVLKMIYERAILPLLLYGAPVWIDVMKYTCNRRKYIRAQRMINLRIIKAFCTTSKEALCIVADTITILLKIEEAVRLYNLKTGRGNQTHAIDREVEPQYWQHPADEAKILAAGEHKDQIIDAYTDGSKTRHGIGSGVALYIGTDLALQERFKLDNRCSNNQAEQLAIIKAVEAIKKIEVTEAPRIATIFTDSRISIDSIRITRNHSHTIEEIRKKMTSLERANWNIELSWVKAHVGIVGNELADRLAKDAANDSNAKVVFNILPMSTLISKIEEETKLKWQKEWEACTKAGIKKFQRCRRSES